MEKTFIKHGSDRKIQIVITDIPDDRTMEDIDFNVTFRAGGMSISFAKEELKHPAENVFVAPLATSNLGVGDLWMSTEVSIPDDDFDGGIRHEYYDYFMNAVII